MKVRQLIAKLKKMPPDADLVWQDHDHGDDEMNATVGTVIDVSDTSLGDRFGCPVVAIRN